MQMLRVLSKPSAHGTTQNECSLSAHNRHQADFCFAREVQTNTLSIVRHNNAHNFHIVGTETYVHSKSDTPETHRAHQKWTQQKNVNKTHVVHKQIALHAQSQSQSLTNANKLSNTTKLNLPKHSHTTNNQMQIPSDHPNVCTPNDLQAANTSRQTSRQTSKQAGKRVPACKRSAPPPGMPGGTPHGCKCYSHLQAAHSWA
jgi:hypothetical protein